MGKLIRSKLIAELDSLLELMYLNGVIKVLFS